MTPNNVNRYFITDSLNGRWESFPLGEKGLKLSFPKQGENIFTYQKKLSGNLKYIGADYRRLKALEQSSIQICETLLLEIEEYISGNWIVATTANLALMNGNWDDDKCIVELEPVSPSIEKKILDAEEIDLFKQIPVESRVKVSTKTHFVITTGVSWIKEENVVEDETRDSRPLVVWRPPAGKESDPLYSQPGSAGFECNYREDITYSGPKGWWTYYFDWPSNSTSFYGCLNNGQSTGDGPTGSFNNRPNPLKKSIRKYIRYTAWILTTDPLPTNSFWLNEYDGGGKRKIARLPKFGEWIDAVTGQPLTGTPQPGTWKDECGKNYVSYRNEKDPPVNIPGASEIPVKVDNGILLKDALTILLGPFDLLPKSRFFNINSDYAIDAQTNYVTGQQSTTASVVIWQKSDVKRYDASENATIFKLSLKSLLNSLCAMCNCLWGVVEGNLVIEHVSYFTSTGILDIRGYQEVVGKNGYRYIAGSYPTKELFQFADKSPEVYTLSDFNGLPIIYETNCIGDSTDNNEINHAPEKVTTHVEYLMQVGRFEIANTDSDGNPGSSNISDDGFVVGSVQYFSEGFVAGAETIYHSFITKGPILDEYPRVNNPFGWAHLHNDFWRHDRYLPSGKLNNVVTTFLSIKPNRQSQEISIPYCYKIDEFNPGIGFFVKSGVGYLEEGELSLQTKKFKLTLNFSNFNLNAWDGIIYAKMTSIPQQPFIIFGECPAEPGLVKEFERREYVILRVDLYMDQQGQVPYLINTWDDIELNISKTNINGSVETINLEAAPGQSFVETDELQTFQGEENCSGIPVMMQTWTYKLESASGATIIQS